MKRGLLSIKMGLTLPSRSVLTRPPAPTVPTLSKSMLSARNNYTTAITTATTIQDRPITSSASKSERIRIFDNAAKARRRQLSQDSKFECHVKQFLEGFGWAEQSIALNLSMEDRLRLGPPNQSPSFIATNCSFQMEVLATLAGIKPCTLFYTPGVDSGQNTKPIFDRLVRTGVLPAFRQYSFEGYGFDLFKIPHHLHIEETGEDWHSCWVLADCRSESWSLTKSIFLAATDQRYHIPTVGCALGYPALSALLGYETRYIYIDMTATRELAERTGSDDGRVIGLNYIASAAKDQIQESREDFERYRQLGKKYGREYAFHYESNPCPEHYLEYGFLQ
jgi:hypothetical protein